MAWLAAKGMRMAYTLETAEAKIKELEKQVEMLEPIHYFARGVMRYNGVDNDRTVSNFKQLSAATHLYTDFLNNMDEDEV